MTLGCLKSESGNRALSARVRHILGVIGVRKHAVLWTAMPGFVPGIHVLVLYCCKKDVDRRDKPGDDE